MSALLFLGQTAPLLGNPTGGNVVAGSATIGSAGSTLTVNQSTQNAIINWQTFSIANGELTKFVVPNLGATLNRVTGGNPSAIYGTLQSNGTLYLVNPSGIVVGASGRIDTASFLASTLDVSNEQFLKGGSLNFAGSSDAAISNSGVIHASTGDVYLIANQVNNGGTISAPHGNVGLAAGNDVLFQQAGSQNLFVQATPAGTKRALGVTNAGTIHAAAAELTAAGGNAYALAINNTGVIAATGYKKVNGQVFLTSDGGTISNSGKISAKQADGNGGTIVVDGTAKASTTSGTVTNSGTLDASATVAGGKGGTIMVKDMGGAAVHSGTIVARGGQGGRGGSAEVSGADVGFTGAVDLRALGGVTGNLLIDPATINIVTGGGTNLSGATIAPSALVAALDGADVTLTGTTSITVSNLVDASGNGSAGNLTLTTPTLTLNAPIILQGSSSLSGSATTVHVGAGGSVQNAVDASSTTAAPTITLAAGATYGLTSQILINKSLTLNGAGAILDGSNGAGAGNGVTRVMEIDGTASGVTVNLNSLTLEFGNASGYQDSGDGGGLLVNGYNGLQTTVNLTSTTVTGNTAAYNGGGIYNDGSYGYAALTLTGSTVSNNTAGTYNGVGGGIYNAGYGGAGALTLAANTTLTGNTDSQNSVGIFNDTGSLTLGIAGNTAVTVGYPIYSTGTGATITVAPSVTTVNVNAPVVLVGGSTSSSSASTVNVGAGSGLENGYLVQGGVNLAADGATVKLTAGTTYNLDSTTGEILISQNLTLNGNGAIIDGSAGAGAGNGTTRVMEVDGTAAGVTVNLNNVTLENGNGAGLHDGSSGGGLLVYGYNGLQATVNLINTTVEGNSAAYNGGGIYNDGAYGFAALTLTGSTVSNNTAGTYNGVGGGIYNAGYGGTGGLTLAANTTLTGNADSQNNGGIYNDNGAMTLGVSGNTSVTVGYPIYNTGSVATITVAPSVTTVNVNAPVILAGGSTASSAATTVNVGAGSGLENGYLVQGGVNLAADGATVNLTAGTTYNLDATTGETVISQNLTLNGNGAILDGSAGGGPGNGTTRVMEILGTAAGVTVNLNNVTLENGNSNGLNDSGYAGGLLVYGYNGLQATVNLTNSTVSGNTSSYDGGGIYVDGQYGAASLTLTGSTVSNNTAGVNNGSYNGGGIYNSGTLQLGAGTTVTANTGYDCGGIYNGYNSTINGVITSAEVYGNMATDTNQYSTGADFYNRGTGEFVYDPDNVGGHTATINGSSYGSGSGATITFDPTVTTINLNAPVTSLNGATINTSVTTANIGSGSGLNNGYLIQSGLTLITGGATVNLAAGTTYDFDNSTGGLSIANSLTLEGNGATLNGQNTVASMISVNATGQNITLNNLTVENGDYGIDLSYNNNGQTTTLNNVTVTGNTTTGIYNYYYYGYTNTLDLNNCTITNNGSSGGGNAAGIFNYYGDTLTLTNCTISNNGSTSNPPTAGGIYNSGTLSFDSSTTVTGNTGYYAGGIYNTGTILGNVTSGQVHGNTATNTDIANTGADFYNSGTATFFYQPDGEPNNSLTISNPIYSSGTGAVITIDPTLATLNVNALVNSIGGATVTSSALTVNVAAASGSNGGALIQGGVDVAGTGATVNLAAGTTYNFDNTTGGLSIANSLTLEGNGATLNGQNLVSSMVSVNATGQNVTLNNFTVENGDYGINLSYNNDGQTTTLNNVTVTGNTTTGIYNYYYYGYTNSLALNNCTITNNGSSGGGNAAGIFNYYGDTLTLTNCTISNNGNTTNPPTAGGINNSGTLSFDSSTTVTGNTGYYAGGIYNTGTILGNVTSSQVHGNTATNPDITNVGADFYNSGTATFVYQPDGEPNNSLTISNPIYSSGTGAVITIDPTLATLNVNALVNSIGGATVTSSALTVNVAAASGSNGGALIQGGVDVAGTGATVNLAAGTTYNFDNSTSGLSLNNSLTLEGNGATLNGQNLVSSIVSVSATGQSVTLNNLTVENGDYGINLSYNNDGQTTTLNNVTVTGNTSTGVYNYYYYGYTNTLALNNCTITNNGSSGGGNAGGIFNYYGDTLTLTNCTISNNGSTTNPPTAGGINNSGTLSFDSATTVTGNTGYYAGGIYNTGTIVGTVTSGQVHGNTATNTDIANTGADFYNSGTATFFYQPDGEPNNSLTISNPIYSNGTGAVITIDPTLTGTLNLDAPLVNINGAAFNSSATTVNINVNAPGITAGGVFNSAATTVNVAAGSGTENGYYAQTGVAFAASGATVNLAAGATYDFDGTTGGLTLGNGVTLEGNGATLNGQNVVSTVLNVDTSDQNVAINNLTVENGSYGINLSYNNSGLTTTLNNVTATGNTYAGIYNYYYYGYTNTLNLNNCTVTGNGGSGGGSAGGIFNYYGDTLNLSNCTISNNGSTTNPSSAGGIYNYGTLSFDSATTVTGNTGYYAGGIYNSGTILGNVTSSQVHGNTATNVTLSNVGTDFYNSGTGTFVYQPDGEPNNNLTITNPIYSYGSGAVITIDPSLTGTLNLNTQLVTSAGAIFNSSAATVNVNAPIVTGGGIINSAATTVNVASGTGTENGYYAQTGVAFAASGATVNLASGTTYNFDGTTGGLTIANGLILDGHGATLNGQNAVGSVVTVSASNQSVTLNNLTVENGSYGFDFSPYNSGQVTTLNNVTVADNSATGIYNYYYYGYANSLSLTNCTITNNGTSGGGSAGGIFNYYGDDLTLTNCTVSNNGSVSSGPTAGGILNYGTMSLVQTAISGNSGASAGGIYNSGNLTVTDSTFSGNATTTAGADVTNYGTYTFIADGNAAIPNTINYTTSDYNGGYATYQATTINWNKAFTNNGNLTLDPAVGSVTVNSPIVNNGGLLLIQAPVITLNATISSTNGNIVLVDTQQFVNNAGATALSAANGFSWQVWSVNAPSSGQAIVDQDGGLTPNFIQYNATYGVTTPASYNNGLLYSNTVGLQVTLNATLTKTYDGTTDLTISPNTYSLSATGQLNGDTVNFTTTNSLTGTLNSKDVDTANAATFDPSQVNFSVADPNGVAVYGYSVEPFSAPATVTPVTVTASLNSGVTETKTYDGTTGASLASNGYSIYGVVSTDSLSLRAGSGTYSDQHVGSGKQVTYSGLGLIPNGGTDANDYTLGTASLSGNVGQIDPATVTAGLTGTVSKTYDATTSATLNSGNYTLAGVIGTDTVTLNDPTNGTYDTPNVGTGKTVTVTGLAISGPNAGDYLLSSTSVAAAVGVINAAGVQMSLTGTLTGTISKVYDGTTSVNNLSAANYTLVGVMNGDTIVLSGPTTGTYATSSVGTGILVTSSPGLSLSGPQAGNYTLLNNQASGNIGTITPATLTITANNDSKTYDTLAYSGGNGVTYSGFQGTDNAASLAGALIYSGTAQGAVNAGTYSITPGGYAAGNYIYVYNSGSLSVGQAALTVTANNQSKIYGATDPALTYGVSGLLGSDTAGVVSGVVLTAPTGAAATAGTHTIFATGGSAQNYTVSDANGTLTVSPATLTVTANNVGKTYDTQAYSGGNGVTYSGFQYTDSASSLAGTLTYSGTSQGAVNAGTYTITPGGYTAGNYTYVYNSGNLTVSQAALTVTANNQGKIYGATDPTLTYSVTGLLGSDTASVVSGISLSTTTGAAATAGTHPIAVTGGGALNYGITDVNGTLTVSPATLTVTANNDSKTYNTLAYNGGNGVTYAGFQYTDSAASLPGTLTYSGTSQGAVSAGTYTITPGGYTAGNYTYAYNSGSLTVGQAALTVTANNQNKIYGAADPTLSFSVNGLLGADTAGVVSGVILNTTTGAAATAGTHPITTTGGTAQNYTVADVNGVLTVAAAPLTVTANSDSKTYNAQAYSGGNGVTYAGFQYTDNAASLSGTLAYSGTAQGAVNVGTYTNTPSGYASPNYTITYMPGSLNITPATLTVAANSDSKTYDTLAYSGGNGVTYSGFQGTDTASSLAGTLSYSGTSQGAVNAGTYAITPGGYATGNYTYVYNSGNLTVNQAAVSVAANNQSKIYGATDPTLTYTVSGLLGNDTASVISGVGLSTTTGAAATAGTHLIIASGGTAQNYTVTDANGTLTVTPAPLTVTANNDSKTYDSNAYSGDAQGVTLTGLKYADTAASLGGALTYTGTAQGAVNVGTYSNTPGGYTSTNYIIAYQPGSLDITRAALTVTANSQNKIYGAADPTLTYSVTGLAQNDTASVVSGVGLGTATGAAATAGTHPIIASGGTAQNYTVTDANGTLTVSPATLTVTANNDSKSYDGLAYTGGNGVTYSGFAYNDTPTLLPGALSYSGSAQGAIDAGTYAITPGGYAAGNYSYVYNSGSLAISPIALTDALTGTVSKFYDGTTVAPVSTSNFVFSGLVSGDTVGITGTAAYSAADVATGVTVVYTGLALTGSKAIDYVLSPTTLSGDIGTITPAPSLSDTTPSTSTGGAASAGSNIVPPVLVAESTSSTPQGNSTTPTTATTVNRAAEDSGSAPPPPISFVGAGTSVPANQDSGGLAVASGNSGQVTKGDTAQISNGELNNVANPHASGVLNQALGPAVFQNLSDALQNAGDWTSAASTPDSGAETATADNTTGPLPSDNGGHGDSETILSGGDVAEMNNGGVKNIPLSQAPAQLRNAMNGDLLKGMANNR